MRSFSLNLLLALIWAGITGVFTPGNVLIGFVLGLLILIFSDRATAGRSHIIVAARTFDFAVFFLWDLILANVRMAYTVLSPSRTMRPGIIAIPLDAKSDIEITLVANLISLTPGTLSIDVSTDRKTLYIHEMFIDDVEVLRDEVKRRYEHRLLKAMR